MDQETVIENIKFLLNKKGLSWYRLSKLTGIHQSTLAEYRNKKTKDIPLANASKICKALDISVDELINKDFTRNSSESFHKVICPHCNQTLSIEEVADEIKKDQLSCFLEKNSAVYKNYKCPYCSKSFDLKITVLFHADIY